MRYALFFTPPEDHDLTRAASAWLSRDAFSGNAVSQHDLSSLPATLSNSLSEQRVSELTSAPRRYGFHGTLKAPFLMAADKDEAEFLQALQSFAQTHTPFQMPSLKVGRLGPFFALVPDGDTSQLNQFTGEVVKTFEPFRAPLTEADYQRRKPKRLSERQRGYLRKWGYPYIFDDFRFHMTLTGPVPDEEADVIEATLESIFQPLLDTRLMCNGLTLFVENEAGGPFRVQTSTRKAL